MTSNNKVRFAVNCGRVLLALALLTLTGAWATQVAEQPILGMSQQHFFNDSIALSLLGIGAFLDALYHAKGI